MSLITDDLSRGGGAFSGFRPVASDLATRAARNGPTLALIPIAALALAFRARMLLVGRSLWLDETALALNICGRTFGGLLSPLDHEQAAPIGFLWIERLSVVLFGPGEIALRLFPFLASIATLILIHRLAAGSFGRWAGVFAVALTGASPALCYYSGELKQYSSDVAMALVILVLGADALRQGLEGRRAAILAAAGCLAVWVSHPVVFVLAGVGSTLIFRQALDRGLRSAIPGLVVASAWLASFAVNYWFFVKNLNSNAYLADFWESGFLQFPPTSPAHLRGYTVVGFGLFEALFQNLMFDNDLSSRMGVVMAAAWMIGAATLYRQGERRMLALLAMPLVFAAAASVLHKYPLRGRLALFTAASTLPVIAAGFSTLLTSRDALNRAVGGVILGCCLLLPTMQGAQFLVERPRLHDARSVLTSVARGWKPGDQVVVDRFSSLPFAYYRQYGGIEGLDRVKPTESRFSLNEPDELAQEVKQWRGRGRVWFVLDTALPDPANLSREALAVLLDGAGRRVESYSCRRYSAHLYQFD